MPTKTKFYDDQKGEDEKLAEQEKTIRDLSRRVEKLEATLERYCFLSVLPILDPW